MAWIPLAAAAITGAASFFGQKSTNSANESMSREQMQFNADQSDVNRMFSAAEASKLRSWQDAQAQTQRNWSEEMSATSYQRAVADLQKAGLNPMLAYSQGGAPMPSASAPSGAMGAGSSASYSNIPMRQNAIQAGISSAMQAMQLVNQQKTGENIDADTELKRAQAAQQTASAGSYVYTNAQAQMMTDKLQKEAVLLTSQNNTEMMRGALVQAQTELAKIETALQDKKIDVAEAEVKLMRIKTVLANLAEPEARNAANAQDSWWMQHVAPYLPSVLRATGGAATISNTIGR